MDGLEAEVLDGAVGVVVLVLLGLGLCDVAGLVVAVDDELLFLASGVVGLELGSDWCGEGRRRREEIVGCEPVVVDELGQV